jgi:hypothetical protein
MLAPALPDQPGAADLDERGEGEQHQQASDGNAGAPYRSRYPGRVLESLTAIGGHDSEAVGTSLRMAGSLHQQSRAVRGWPH